LSLVVVDFAAKRFNRKELVMSEINGDGGTICGKKGFAEGA